MQDLASKDDIEGQLKTKANPKQFEFSIKLCPVTRSLLFDKTSNKNRETVLLS